MLLELKLSHSAYEILKDIRRMSGGNSIDMFFLHTRFKFAFNHDPLLNYIKALI